MAKDKEKAVNYGYGYIPDYRDPRDHMFAERFKPAAEFLKDSKLKLPPKADVTKYCPDAYDQGTLGSCTAQGLVGCLSAVEKKFGLPYVPLSRLMIYYNEREMEGTVKFDAGAMIRDGIKSLEKIGVCHEEKWPYDIKKFRVKPSDRCYQLAEEHKIINYQRLTNIIQTRCALAHEYPVVFGFTVYTSFETQETAKRGIMPMPQPKENIRGGHCVFACGYDDDMEVDGQKGFFLVQNSWSKGWGLDGRFWMPYDAFLLYGSDTWSIYIAESTDGD